MQGVREQIRALACLPWHVRIEGPTGSGKNVAARMLHQLSTRALHPFVCCSLAMLPDGLELSELVGHRRGAFTGAVEDRAGAFEAAHTGTLFLDEIGTASPQAQRYLLRLVDEGVTRRLGEYRDRPVDVRLLFATNVDLEAAARQGAFRDDLLARMRVLILKMPALAEHPEDIPELAEHFLERKCREAQMRAPPLGDEAMGRLMAFSWPRNVRDLESAVEHYVAFGRLPDTIARVQRSDDWRARLDEVLHRHRGNRSRAAEELGVSRKSVHEELRRRGGAVG
jgi:DNA-binding NtrC family response regulator